MSELILPTCDRCGGPKYVRGEPRGHDSDGNPLFVYWDCRCNPPAVPKPIPDPTVADSIRWAGGCVMNCGYMVNDGDRCPCCGEAAVVTPRPGYMYPHTNTVGMFYHDGKMTWVCQSCWDKHTPEGE